MILLSKPSKTARLFMQEESTLQAYFSHGRDIALSEEALASHVSLLIRWGTTDSCSITFDKQLNSSEAIRLASDKPKARNILLLNGLPVPASSESYFPVIGRTTHHSGGSGFFLCKNALEVEKAKEHGAMYFSAFYDKQEEYRIHVAGEKTLLISVKEGNKDKMIWNRKINQFRLRHLHRSVWLEDSFLLYMQRIAKRAVYAFGLDFGAVEIGINRDNDMQPMVIFEVNTAPALSPLARQKYLNYFRGVEALL